MRQKYRDHKKHSHSFYSMKRGKKATGVHSYFFVGKQKETETKAIEDSLTTTVVQQNEAKKTSKAKFLKNLNFRQKEKEARKKREKKIKKARKNLEAAKENFTAIKTDYTSASNDIKSQIKQLKAEQKQQKKTFKEAKKALKASKKEMKDSSKRHLGVFTSVLATLFLGLGVLLYAVVQWLITTWPNLKMDELMYEATAPLEGTGSNMITAFIQQAVVPMIIAIVIAIIAIIILTKAGKMFRRIGKTVMVVFSCVCIAIAGITFWNHLDVGEYVINQTTTSDFIKDEYVDPATTEITFPETKRNLIYIYLESMEMSYADKENGGARDENVIPKLTKLAEENEDFSGTDNTILNGAYSMPSTTWTMGGLFAATAGLPLQTDVGRNTMTTQSTFFPGITTLGDILESEGYNQTFACGSPVSFGGRELYFEEHGNYTFHDYTYASNYGIIPSGYYVWWGFEDDRLIEMAKNDITEMASGDQPFNYTMLTVDTHFEDGYLDDGAENKFDDHYSNVIFNSDKEITEFISWCKKQSWYENTTIVISGDHPTMDSDYMTEIDTDYQRRVYTCYINSAVEVENNVSREFTTFDNFPTTLAAMGVTIEGNKLGLGTNLFSSTPTLTEKYGLDKEKSELNKKSTFMSELSGNDVTTDDFQEYLSEEGIRSSVVYLQKYDAENKLATLSVDDIFYTGGNIDYVSITITHPDGSSSTSKSTHVSEDGRYDVVLDVSNGGLEDQTISVDAHVRIEDTDALKVQNIYEYSGNLGVIPFEDNLLQESLHSAGALDQSRYAILITTQGDALEELSEIEKTELLNLGIPSTFFDDVGNTRYAIFSKGTTVLKEGTGYIRDSGNLTNGAAYTISSADSSGSYATITVGNSWGNLTNYADGVHLVVYDMVAGSVVGTCDFNTAEKPWNAKLYATYDEETDTITYHADDAKNSAGGQLDVEVVIWDKNDVDDKMEIGMSSSNNSEWSVELEKGDRELSDLYAVCYLRSRQSNWHRVDEGSTSHLIEIGETIQPAETTNDNTTEVGEDGTPPEGVTG